MHVLGFWYQVCYNWSDSLKMAVQVMWSHGLVCTAGKVHSTWDRPLLGTPVYVEETSVDGGTQDAWMI